MEDEILVGIDGSEHSAKIVDVASEIAKQMSLKILLVYVMKDPVEEPEGLVEYEKAEEYRDAYADLVEQLSHQVTEKFGHRLEKLGVQFRSMAPSGNPAAEIIEIANLEKVKMIVIGMKGHHSIIKIRSLGSVTRRVIENSKCPVLIVPPDD